MRFREWYENYNPELSKKEHDQEKFVREAIKQERKSPTAGGKFSKEDLAVLKLFATSLRDLYARQSDIEKYMADCMQDYCPNIKELAGVAIGAKLLAVAHGLRNLAIMSSSRLQLLGAEKALFRHLLGKGKSPKHGLIINHPISFKTSKTAT